MLRVFEDSGRRRAAHAAGYGDLGRALLDLQAAADQVFDTVSKRTAEEREKLSAISMRIKAAKAKIKALSQSEEPLTIVSPALHPSSSTKQEDYRPLFHDKHGLPIATIAVNGGFNREYGLEGTLELFQFFSEENCDYPSTSKPTDKFPKTKDGTYLENLLQTANHPAPGTHLASGTKSDELPPPPPSLLPKHLLEWLTGGECLAGMHEVVVTKRTLDAIALAKEQNRSLWRVSSTLFTHIASDAILKPLGHFADTPDAHSYPPICAGDYVEQELSLINLKGKDGV